LKQAAVSDTERILVGPIPVGRVWVRVSKLLWLRVLIAVIG